MPTHTPEAPRIRSALMPTPPEGLERRNANTRQLSSLYVRTSGERYGAPPKLPTDEDPNRGNSDHLSEADKANLKALRKQLLKIGRNIGPKR